MISHSFIDGGGWTCVAMHCFISMLWVHSWPVCWFVWVALVMLVGMLGFERWVICLGVALFILSRFLWWQSLLFFWFSFWL